jgi:ADP-ribose pyrophosphatase YjhB (NUDIX family)
MRHTRYQGAIAQNDRLLLIRHTEHKSGRHYWIIPGGGREPNETEIECVKREMHEETNLNVKVIRLLSEKTLPDDHAYKMLKTYLCRVVSGKPSPGIEPEEDAAAMYAITKVAWFDLRSEESWELTILENPITFTMLQEIRQALGYDQHPT